MFLFQFDNNDLLQPKAPSERQKNRIEQSKSDTRLIINTSRYRLDPASMPPVIETLPVSEAVRRAIMKIHGDIAAKGRVRGRSDTFSGKDITGVPLSGHRHAYYLPADEDGDGRLDHITIYAEAGFNEEEVIALACLRVVFTGLDTEKNQPLRLFLIELGNSKNFDHGPMAKSNVWRSATPYISTRFFKTRGRNSVNIKSPEDRIKALESDIRRILAEVRTDLSEATIARVEVQPIPGGKIGPYLTSQFKRRRRRKSGDDGGRRMTGAFKIILPEAVKGPLALGWSSHFGMGLFLPAD